ncbi:MAG: DUF6178 family protein [Desulfuromonadaceae bacterium]|nr:DUF6178 family protein [Desulfuromonadaceae bacterium]
MSKIELPGEKRKGPLTLRSRSRATSVKEFNALSAEERLIMVHGAQGRAKYDLLLDATDGQQLLQLLPPQDLYLLVKELGHEDSKDLLAMASPNQIVVCVDLDGWKGDEICGAKSLDWLLAAIGTDPEELLPRLHGFDFDLLVLILQRSITVLKGPEDLCDDDQEPGSGVMPYEFEFLDEEQAKPLYALVGALFCQDEIFCRRLLEALRSELPSVLEEEVYQQRRNRLLDYGFPDPVDAMAVYARLDVEAFDLAEYSRPSTLPEPGPVAPGFVLTPMSSQYLLAEVLSAGIDASSVWDLSFLLNRVMVADGIDVGDSAAVQETLEKVYGCLNVALEQLCGSALEKAREVFDGTYLLGLFRLGHNVTLRLQEEARRLLDSDIGAYLDGPYAALVMALQGRMPCYCIAFDGDSRAGELPFSTLRQVEATRQRLAEVEVQRRLFEERFDFELPHRQELEVNGVVADDAEQLTLSDFFLTALANRVLGRDFVPAPISPSELPVLHRLIAENGRLSEALRQQTLSWLESLEPGAGSFGDFCFSIWEEEFCALDATALDPRYIGGLLVK